MSLDLPFSWNATTIADDGVQKTVSFSGGWDNYFWDGQWARINPVFQADGSSWLHDESPWSIHCPQFANKRITLVNEQKYDPHQRSVLNPGSWPELQMDHPDASSFVAGEIDENNPGRIIYRNALGDGCDIFAGLWYRNGTRYPRAEHLICIRTLPSGGGEYVSIRERIYTALRIVGAGGSLWDGSPIDIGPTGAILLTTNGDAGIVMRPAVAWYYTAAGELVTLSISVIAERMAGYTLITKKIPRWFIEAALAEGAYVLADETTTTFYSNANPETVSVDGTVTRSGTNLTWSDIRTGSGTASADSGAFGAGVWLDTGTTTDGWALMRRSIFLFDTSAIGSTNAVSAATFGIYGSARTNTYAETPTLGVVSSNPASNTALANSDYGSFGTTDYATRVSYSGWSGGGGLSTWSFNATGIAAVSTTGLTKLGTRVNWDIDNSPPTWGSSKLLRMTGNFAEIGDSTKAYLSVTYAAATGNRRRRVLLAGVL